LDEVNHITFQSQVKETELSSILNQIKTVTTVC